MAFHNEFCRGKYVRLYSPNNNSPIGYTLHSTQWWMRPSIFTLLNPVLRNWCIHNPKKTSECSVNLRPSPCSWESGPRKRWKKLYDLVNFTFLYDLRLIVIAKRMMKKKSFVRAEAQWFGTAKNREISTGPLARPFTH